MRVINSKFSRFIFYVSILFCISLVFQCFVYGASNVSDADTIIDTESTVLTAEEQEVLNLINEQRRQYGLSELKAYGELQRVAKIKAQDLVNNNYFSHTSPSLRNTI